MKNIPIKKVINDFYTFQNKSYGYIRYKIIKTKDGYLTEAYTKSNMFIKMVWMGNVPQKATEDQLRKFIETKVKDY